MDVRIDDVVTSFGKAIRAENDLQQAREGYTGYDFSYYGYEFIKCADECNKDAEQMLTAYVKQLTASTEASADKSPQVGTEYLPLVNQQTGD